MHPLLRCLDLTTGDLTTGDLTTDAGQASSVHDLRPIRDAAAPRPRGLPLLLSLGLAPLLIFGLAHSLNSPASARVAQGALNQARNTVIQLLEPAPQNVKAPARKLLGPEGPGGMGHREGTNSLDPRLAAYTSVLSRPSDAVDPEELTTAPTAERVDLSLNPALPAQAGGNGLAKGTARDSALGPGGLLRPPKTYDFKLIPTRQVPVAHQLTAGENSMAMEPLRVRVVISEDGTPTQATLISGPDFLREKAIKAALEWRWEPLGPHGLKAPLTLTLIFHPNLLRLR